MNKILDKKIHELLNSRIEVKRALTKEQSRVKLLDEKRRKIFLSDFEETLTESK